MQNGKWTWNENDSEYWNNDSFDTPEEALFDAWVNIEEDVNKDIKGAYIGQVKDFVPRISSFSVLEQLQENAYETCGESAESYLEDVSKEHEKELQKTLTMVFNLWAEKYGYTPDFHIIDKIKFVEFE